MARPKTIKPIPLENPNKYTRIYEDDESITTWTYNLDIFSNGPISVEIKTKNEQTNGKKAKNTRRTDNVLIENEKVKRGRRRQE
jgi:hypothetical protein